MIKELRNKLDKKEISARELTDEYLKRIKSDLTNSYITVCEEKALFDADLAQKMIDEKRSSALTGIPISVKDNIITKGVRTTCASKMLYDYIPPYDATTVTKLKSNGAVILGKTNMDEFAMGSDSTSSYFGTVKNPLDSSRTAGGSSGGAAASVAGQLAVAALGSDTGGSVRQPSAFCGVVGLLPTHGRVSRYGLVSFASSLDQIGICASTAQDAGIVLGAIAGTDKNDMSSSHHSTKDFTTMCNKTLSGTKLGVIKEFAEFFDLKILSDLGCEIKEVSLPSYKYIVPTYYIISSAEASSNLARFDGVRYGFCSDEKSYAEAVTKSRTEAFGEEVRKRITLGIYALGKHSDNYYKKALSARAQLKDEMNKIFADCDAIVTPTTPFCAYKYGEHISPDEKYPADMYTAIANLCGLPSISVPFGNHKMPLGLCITGREFCEAKLIQIADKIEGN